MNELTNEVTEEVVIRDLTIDELENVNGGCVCTPGDMRIEDGILQQCDSGGGYWFPV